jgi:hypothetical protein
VEILAVPVYIESTTCRHVAMLGLDFANLPSLLILSSRSFLAENAVCANPAACPRPRETEPLPICMQMVESPLARRAASSY